MSKIELPTITSGHNLSAINNNFQKIEDALNKEVLYRKNYVGEPNEMQANLDMNSKEILNVSVGSTPGSLATKGYVDQEISEERTYVDQQLAEVDNSLSTKYDKTGGVLSGDVLMQGHKIKGLTFATENSEPVTLGQVLDIDSGTGLQASITAFEALRRSYAEVGYNLIGRFSNTGLVVNSATDVVLWEPTGVAYSWSGGLPHTIGDGETPVGNASWVSRSTTSLKWLLAATTGSKLVGFKQAAISYTGPAARTVEGKLFDVVSVKDFGAVGDGVTDDSAAFLKAILYVLHIDVGGAAYPNKVFGKTIFVPAGTYEIKSKVVATLGYSMAISLEGESELTTFISVNNPNGFLDLTMTSRAASLTVSNMTLLAKYGTASSQPGVGRDDLPVTLADVHDISSGVGIKITYPAGILTAKTKSLKMTDVIMTGWNRTRGDYFSEGVYLTGGRNPTLVRVVVEGKYGALLTGRPDELFSAGTGFKMIDSYSPTLEDCYCNHYVRGFDLTSQSDNPSYSSSEGGQIVRSTFDALYGIRVVMPGGEPHFNVLASHLNYTRIGIDLSGKNQVNIKDCLFYCEASVEGTVARDIVLRGAQKSQITGNIFAKTNTGDRYCISLYRQPVTNVPNTSLVLNNNLYWAGAVGTFRVYSLSGGGSASNVTIGDGECYENDMSLLFTLGSSDHAAINPMRFNGSVVPEGVVWAPLGSLYVNKTTGIMYKKGGTLSSSNGWTLIP